MSDRLVEGRRPQAVQGASFLDGAGVHIDLGACMVAVRSTVPDFAQHFESVYRSFPLYPARAFADFHVAVLPVRGLRRWLRPQVALTCDGEILFDPFPADTALPLFEWGVNWLIGQRLNHLLMFHAGCLERDGHALLLPAVPGSGKSTLTAALAHRGWRLLSDEFGVLDPEADLFVPLLKPVALKNESIDVIRAFAPTAVIGPRFPKTRKGTVAHVAATPEAVARRHERAKSAMVVLPRWERGHPTQIEPIADDELFRALAFNSFNYEVLGETAFDAVIRLVRRCSGWRLVYGDLEDAVQRIDALWDEHVRRRIDGGDAAA